MKAQELRQLSAEALRSKAEELRGVIGQLRFSQYQGKEKNVKRLQALRHELAQVLTVLTEYEKTSHSSQAK